jgi:hypothetical protein
MTNDAMKRVVPGVFATAEQAEVGRRECATLRSSTYHTSQEAKAQQRRQREIELDRVARGPKQCDAPGQIGRDTEGLAAQQQSAAA